MPSSKTTAFSSVDNNINMYGADSADPNTQPLSFDNPASETPCASPENISDETQSLPEVTLHLMLADELFSSNPDVTHHSVTKNGKSYVTTIELQLKNN